MEEKIESNKMWQMDSMDMLSFEVAVDRAMDFLKQILSEKPCQKTCTRFIPYLKVGDFSLECIKNICTD